jgi:hypothetical protein
MTRRLAGFMIAGLAVAVVTIPAKASDPIDTYCMVEKVVFEPEDCPDRAQIWGACARVNRRTAGTMSASRGYFYYAVPTGREEAARAEWMDLKSVAGKDQVVGFGGLRGPQARFRGTAEKPAAPETYPLNVGVVKLHQFNLPESLVTELKTVMSRR